MRFFVKAALVATVLLLARPAIAIEWLLVGENALSPIGWVGFCEQYPEDCKSTQEPLLDIVFSAKVFRYLVSINNQVNNTVRPMADIDHWGVEEKWSYPDDGYGDCEDFVLLKRRKLLEAGWPRSALLITVVRDQKGGGHAVLTIETTQGEFILDNQTAEILQWDETNYAFVRRQSRADQNVWVNLFSPMGRLDVTAGSRRP